MNFYRAGILPENISVYGQEGPLVELFHLLQGNRYLILFYFKCYDFVNGSTWKARRKATLDSNRIFAEAQEIDSFNP